MKIDPDTYRNLLVSRNERILTITLNRPHALNAIDGAMHEELARVFTDANADEDSDLIIVTGSGKAFSSGGDIEWMQTMIDDERLWDKTAREAKAMIFSMLDCEKPVIAKVNGHATGLGATIALFCDLVFMAERAKIGDPHVSVGFVAGDGGAIIWPLLVGPARAKQYLLSGDLMDAAHAERIGLVNAVVRLEDLDETVLAYANKLLGGARLAIKWTKMSVNAGIRQSAATLLDVSLAYEGRSNATCDHQEAVAAFRERRPPAFTGS